MIERIIEFSIRNRFLVLIVTAALTIAGIYATLHTPVDAIPDLSENQVIVFADWMGRSPREIDIDPVLEDDRDHREIELGR